MKINQYSQEQIGGDKMNIDQICQEIKMKMGQINWHSYWPNFKPVAYSIYNKDHVFLFNHPAFSDQNEPSRFEWEEQFVGDTLILFKDYPTAIVNIDRYQSFNQLFAVLMHELFHGYQSLMDETRFPDELSAVSYPLEIENIELRTKERYCLDQALHEEEPNKRMGHLQAFVEYRTKRESILKDSIQYEYMIESVEGPAWYIELLALVEVGDHTFADQLTPYRHSLLDAYESNLHLRRSCYSSGLFMCLLLEKLDPQWKGIFIQSELSLYQLLTHYIDQDHVMKQEENEDQSHQANKVYHYVHQQKSKKIDEFDQCGGYKLMIEGDMKATFFDPMNMINVGDKLLHRYFVKLQINQQDYLINQPALAHHRENILQVDRLQLNLQHKPIFDNGVITIDGIGAIRGNYTENGSSLHLTVQ